MLRSFVLADVITLGNASCGTGAIFSCLRYVGEGRAAYLWTALGLLPLALLCDVLDGSVARWRHRHSALGADLDSLADVVSFGVAPAVLAFALGMRGTWDAIVLIYFVACGISRLARYNATHDELAGDDGKVRYYEGTPIPTSLLLVMLLGVAFGTGHVGARLWLGSYALGPWDLHPLTLLFAVSGSAMISARLRIPKP
ncbi:MAG: CDP-alcohol phosphatidyltransferase family protein [Polyangiales bacterium]